ncbi:MerR family transcriptional regulator [Micromonospora haikouensis]|uniref:MerR family transcriptional regulator n=1 Tax=Micromonospora haikouensis TaxID=686309 RepID=UPI003449B1C9
MTIDQLAAEVWLTPRTIRSYHTRGLLQPPNRVGRTPYYDRPHLNRMRTVALLQGQGLSLETICALLDPDGVIGKFILPNRTIDQVLRADPSLTRPLIDSGVLLPRPDGAFSVRGARAVLAARVASRPDAPLTEVLHVLAGSVTAIAPLADELLNRVGAELLCLVPGGVSHREELLDLVVEALRVGLQTRAAPAA